MRLWLSLLFLFAAGCAADGYYPAAEMCADEFVGAEELSRAAASPVDDVSFDVSQGGGATRRMAGTASGLMVVDGEGFTDNANLFADTDDDGLPDARAPGAPPVADEPAPRTPREQRMLIYRGNLAIEVPRAEDAAKAFLAQVETWGGYLQSQTGTRLSVRLPAERFDAAFAAAKGAGRVLHEQRSASDVTEEFVDLGIRLDNAKKSRERLIELLQKADKVEDMLKIENELRRLTEEIERMEGRVKFLRDQVAMATLDIEFRSVAEAPPLPPHRRQPSRFSWINLVGASNLMERF